MNEWKLFGSVKSIEENGISLETESGTFKIGYIEALKQGVSTIQVGDKVGLRGKLEASKGIKLVAEKIIGFKRG